jgi:hypothetical protein
MALIDLDREQAGTLCDYCGDSEGHAPAAFRSRDGVPLCEFCFVDSLRMERDLRDLAAAEDGRVLQ